MLIWLSLLLSVVFANISQDPYLWLEEVEGKKAIEWVKKQNEGTLAQLEADSRYKTFLADAKKILNAPDKLAQGTLQGEHVVNFWQDEKNVRGLWRRATLASYKSGKPVWETLIDLDELAKKDKENWVFKRANCFGPAYDLCMVALSRGGKDATIFREFSVAKKQFVKKGFELPEMKANVEWYDENTLIAGLTFNDKMKTDSGYARQVQVWKRGEKAKSAPVVYEIDKKDVGVWTRVYRSEDEKVIMLERSIDMITSDISILENDFKTVTKLALPKKNVLHGYFKGMLLVSANEDWSVKDSKGKVLNIRADELVAFNLKKFKTDGIVEELYTLYTPSKKASLQGAFVTKNYVYVSVLDNVRSKQLRKEFNSGKWSERQVDIKDQGASYIGSTNPFQDDTFITNTNFLTPTQILYLNASGKTSVVQSLPERFNSKNLIVEQKFTKSADGTEIPFFIIRNKNIKLDGNQPTLLYGYGGFGIPMLPSYMQLAGKLWIERGGIFVLANIRGGDEFGSQWHLSVLHENRIKCYEDFIAVAEKLIKMKYTSTPKLGIQGGSNGGLLVSASMVLRPDLFGAVVSQVPLTDMLRFHKLLAGASWMGEYGNPEEPKIHDFWTKYSPFQNVKKEVKYPPIFFVTSTKDDRVHPGHARKMAARMKEFGQDVSYYENIEGGHSASANLLQVAKQNALSYVFLSERLGLK